MEREREGWIGGWLEGVLRSGKGNGRGDSAREFCGGGGLFVKGWEGGGEKGQAKSLREKANKSTFSTKIHLLMKPQWS
jgi:hypothetical protein